MSAKPAKPTTIDEYLAATSPAQRAVLERLRRAIHAAAPGAEEYLGYGLAGFKHGGRPLVYLGAWKEHCALYAASPRTQATFAAELKDFEVSKGTIRFTVEKPLPLALVKRLVRARVAENAARKPAKKTKPARGSTSDADVTAVLASLKRLGKPAFRAEMEPHYGIVAKDAFGVPMAALQGLAKRLGRNQALAEALWSTGNYEARTVAALIAEPERVTAALMDRWCRDFDNWAICDTVCFKLFDQTPHAFAKIEEWAGRTEEFQKRAAFALLACVALHDKNLEDEALRRGLDLIEAAAGDDRNFVKKAVSWALRAIGTRRTALTNSAVQLAKRLGASNDRTRRWIGKDALRALNKAGQ
ncbi:MAG: DNA alkylation repair protein [Verrucomicrobiales bacterium]|nr:DNA alkylation repair protein [Verrucomicrobiales bacterium]